MIFSLKLYTKRKTLVEINWDFRCIIMVQSGQILWWSNEAILQPVLEKSASHIHIGALLFFMHKFHINICIKTQNVSASKFNVLVRRNVGRCRGCHQNSGSSILFEGVRPSHSARSAILGGKGFLLEGNFAGTFPVWC